MVQKLRLAGGSVMAGWCRLGRGAEGCRAYSAFPAVFRSGKRQGMDIDAGDGSPVVVAMPAEVDLINAERVYDQLYAALISGAAVVIADFTATAFCDSAGMNMLITIHKRAGSRGVQFCLVLPSGGTVRRVLKLLGPDQMLPVYSTVAEATSALTAPVPEPSSFYSSRHER